MRRAERTIIHGTWLSCLIVLMVTILSVKPLASQLITSDVSQYAHTEWLASDGFFRTGLTAIAQTKDGYIWLGSETGLLKFDGVNFTPIQLVGGLSLANVHIASLLGAKDGSLWIGTDGKGLLHLKDGRITSIPAFDNTLSVSALLQDHAGDIWAGGLNRSTPNRLCRVHSESVECFGDTKTFGVWIERLFEDKLGNLWIGADTGFLHWAPGPPRIMADESDAKGIGLAINTNDVMVEAGRNQSPHRSDESLLRPTDISLRTLTQCRFLTDRNGGLWIGTYTDGIVHSFHGRVDTFRSTDGLSSDRIVDMLEDNEGDIWVVTGKGLDRFRELAISIVTRKQGLSSDGVQSVVAEGKNIWIGGSAGLDLVKNDSIRVFGKRDGLPTGDVRSLYWDAPWRLLIATGASNGLAWMQDERITKFSTPLGGNDFIITADGSGGFWLSNREAGLLHVPRGGTPVETLPWSMFGNKTATAMAFDSRRKGLWIAFNHGDLEFLQNSQVQERYLNPLENPRDLQVASDGAVWLASNAGLARLLDGHPATLTSRNGLPCDGVNWRKDDDDHFTWLETPCGVVELPPGELDRWSHDPNVQVHITKYLDNSDGAENVLIGHYYSPTVAVIPDGRLAFVTTSGVAVIDPHKDLMNHLPPPVHVDHIEADARTYSSGQTVVLPPNIHVVRLGYSALDFRSPEKVRYRYRLEGYDTHWSEVLSTREAVYTKLPPGSYRFHVVACNGSGVWNYAGDSIDLTVKAAFYQTKWFMLLCIASLIVLLWIGYHSRMRYLCQQAANRIEVRTAERLNISQDIHDTLLQGAQGLILSFHALSEDANGNPSLQKKMASLIDRAENVVLEARDKIRALRFEKQLDPSFVRTVESIADRMRVRDLPAFRLSVTGQEVQLKPLVYEEVCFICREALSNAFRHADAQLVEVLISFERSRFGVTICDNGLGIPPQAVKPSYSDAHWGIIGMKERAGRIGAKFDIKSAFPGQPHPGTSVTVEVPAPIAYTSATA